MEFTSREFKLFSAKLSNMIITKGTILLNQNIGFGDPFSDMTANNIGEVEGFVLNHEYNKSLNSKTFEKEFLTVRKELDDNLKNPLVRDILTYIKYVLDLYQQTEQKIIEKVDGSYSADFIKFEDCDPKTINNGPFGNYDLFLGDLKNQLRQEILFLRQTIDSFTTPISKNSKKERDNLKSFQLVSTKITEEMLKEFKENLEKNGLIEKIDFRLFASIFGNNDVKNQIVWKTKPTELYYVIRTLREEKIIKPTQYWKTTSRCFLLKLENGEVTNLTAKFLSHCGPPSPNFGERYRILNSVLSCVI